MGPGPTGDTVQAGGTSLSGGGGGRYNGGPAATEKLATMQTRRDAAAGAQITEAVDAKSGRWSAKSGGGGAVSAASNDGSRSQPLGSQLSLLWRTALGGTS